MLADTATPHGVRLGDYMLDRQIGKGGMGEVFAARALERGHTVALKTLSLASAAHLYRFKREFRALADVTHDNLIKLFELGVTPAGQTFFTMELLEGEHFVDWVRRGVPPETLPDLTRLEVALRQLVSGVLRLHDSGCVHRDLKPSNVLVTADGRVVVLDFGLISEPEHGVTRDGQMLGTPAYMAPEQALGQRAGPAADFYAIGVMLYQCLTGRLPHTGTVMKMLVDKQYSLDFDATLQLAPVRLRELCLALLERDASRRLDRAGILARLEGGPPAAHAGNEVFVGRLEQLAELHDRYAELCRHNSPVVVHLRGGSGQGKSALLRRFRQQLEHERSLIFHGRCRQRESVPFKGVDAVVDTLSAYLRRLPTHELAKLRPRSVGALVRVFPVLDELWPDAELQALSPRELRGVSWAALREVITNVATHRPLIIEIDDFQWADVDSVQLLHALLRPPGPPPLLLILTLSDDGGDSDVLRELAGSEFLGRAATTIELGPLSEADARELVVRLAERRPEASKSGVWAETIALRSGGNPMFIAQLVQETGPVASDDDLDTIFARHVEELDEPSQRVLEIVAVSGGPLTKPLALELCPGASQSHVEQLLAAGLLVEGRAVNGDARVETAHDRIRQVALAKLTVAMVARLHTELGECLLAHCARKPEGELLFRIVDQLDAGIVDAAELDEARRLELARLNCEAGDRALQTASHALAQGYFERAYEFVTPWIGQARDGGGQYELCVAIMFGRLRAARDLEAGGRMFDEVVSWTLAPRDYGRICVEHISNSINTNRLDDGLALGLTALRKLGVRLPRRPSLLWALWQLVRGQRAMTKLGAQGLLELRAADDDVIVAMSNLASLMAVWMQISPSTPLWGVGIAGLHAQLVVKHGFHDTACLGLGMLVTMFAVMGKTQRAFLAYDTLVACEPRWPMSPANRAHLTALSFHMSPHREPIFAVAARVDDFHRRCVELGQYRIAVLYPGVGVSLHAEADTPLPQLIALSKELEARTDRGVDLEFERATTEIQKLFRTLIEGRESAPKTDPRTFRSLMSQCGFTLRNCWVNILFDDYTGTWDALQSYLHNYEQALIGSYATPIYATVSVIVMAERYPSVSRRERRRLDRLIRKCRKTTAAWAANCEANYGPMLALIDAEIATLAGHIDEATRSYDRARTLATANRMLWVSGLASHRLAITARRHGHRLLVEAALRAARDTYEAWGAAALVRMLDAELRAG